jgi:hypothetical protein
MLPLRWAPLSALERAVAAETIHTMLRIKLDAHQDAIVHLETSEAPPDLCRTLDDLADATGRLTYAVVPQLSPVADDTGRP